MRKFLIVFVLFGSNYLSSGQLLNQASVKLSFNQLELNFQRKMDSFPYWGEVYVGVGNMDINRAMDDVLAGIRVGTVLFEIQKSVFTAALVLGMYLPRNDYYKVTTPVYGLNVGYAWYFLNTPKHAFLFHAGYQYGKRSYKQEYQSDRLYIANVDDFKVFPVYVSVGYGFKF